MASPVFIVPLYLKKRRETHKERGTDDSTRRLGQRNQSLEGLWPNSRGSNVSSVDLRGADIIKN